MQIKTTTKYHHTTVRTPIIKKRKKKKTNDNTEIQQGYITASFKICFHSLLVGIRNGTAALIIVPQLIIELDMDLTYYPSFSFLGRPLGNFSQHPPPLILR